MNEETAQHDRVGLAISCHASDPQTLTLLEDVFAAPCRFDAVIVVDSEGDGSIPAAAEKNGWPILYFDAPENLGAAGNHAKRLELAAKEGLAWCYFLNHDGHLDCDNLRSMLETATRHEDVGAVYPLLYNESRAKPWEDGRRSFVPSARQLSRERPKESADEEVAWGSSNGALYSLRPYRSGVRVPTELWHGYEDLAYGALMYDNAWKQYICRKAVLRNAYEYSRKRFCGVDFYIPDKPSWYAYYSLRNLALIQRRRRLSASFLYFIVKKALSETVVILLLKKRKLTSLRLLWLGLLHGATGRGGKGKWPESKSDSNRDREEIAV